MSCRSAVETILIYLEAILCAAVLSGTAIAQSSERPPAMQRMLEADRITGGLCVQIGCEDLAIPAQLARSGRFLVQVLDRDAARVDRARRQLQTQGRYGIVSVDQIRSSAHLPYEENLVNALILQDGAEPSGKVLAEIGRVLRPGGLVMTAAAPAAQRGLKAAGFEGVRTIGAERKWLVARKPWPAAMDQWSHPWHGADGNTVSSDTLVGPPRRIRWIAGPSRESSQLVTAGGRNFYADVLARDSFNGLPLWQRPLKASGRALPVAAGDLLFVVTQKKLLAVDAATGKTVREYPEAGTPTEVLAAGGVLVTTDGRSVRAIAIGKASSKTSEVSKTSAVARKVSRSRLRWKYDGAEPRAVAVEGGAVYLVQGSAKRGEKAAVVSLDLATGRVRWQKDDYPWAAKIRRIVAHNGLLVYEVSTFRDQKPGNAIHVASADDGRLLWSRDFVPDMNHRKQARAMFIGGLLWVLELPRKGVALDPKTGKLVRQCPAGLCHCFPPVATERYLISGEMELTDLASGRLDANRITKAACSPNYGWVPANGLIYACPKHCVCWPMVRGYVAMAPALPGENDWWSKDHSDGDEELFEWEGGVAPPQADAETKSADTWPCYRQNAWRSASTTATVPPHLKTLWTVKLGDWPKGIIADDWRDDDFVRGPVTPPVIAAGAVYVARPDAQQVVALDAQSGVVRWRYTANGRIDTPPTVHRGLCLFGTRSGWVYCLRASDGRLVWRLRAAPNDRRIVTYGQIESPWPVPGSVLVVDGVAYFAAGRQSLADGGIRVFAVEPATGKIRWVKRLDTLPMTDFYASIGLEFDNFELLQREGDGVAMSRWLFDRRTGQMTCKAREAFMVAKMGGSGVVIPGDCWSYAPRHQPRHKRETPTRGLVAFRGNMLLGCLDDGRTVYRRDFKPSDLAGSKKLEFTWFTGWAAGDNATKGKGDFWLSQRLAHKATWSVPLYDASQRKQHTVAMLLAGDVLFTAGVEGDLTALSPKDGRVLAHTPLPAPVWDGMAAAEGRLFVSTQAGETMCLGASE